MDTTKLEIIESLIKDKIAPPNEQLAFIISMMHRWRFTVTDVYKVIDDVLLIRDWYELVELLQKGIDKASVKETPITALQPDGWPYRKPCPFCKSPDAAVRKIMLGNLNDWTHYVACRDCGVETCHYQFTRDGEPFVSPEHAIEMWNTRAGER